MSLTDKIAEKLAGALGWLILKELRRIATALETAVDDRREKRGLQPFYHATRSPFEPAGRLESPATDDDTPIDQEAEPDLLRMEILEMLARDHQILITPETDLIALGKARGWLDEVGMITMLPKNYPG